MSAHPGPTAGLAIALAIALAGCNQAETGPGEPGGVAATATTGFLHGVVTDEAVRPIGGANVTISSAAGPVASVATEADGTFAKGDLPPGSYVVEARKERFLTATVATQVQAGITDPPPLVLALAPDALALAYADLYHWAGFLECSLDFVSLCGAFEVANRTACQNTGQCPGDPSANDFDEIFLLDGRPTFLQAELVWEPTLDTARWMQLFLQWGTPGGFGNGLYDGGAFDVVSGPSPIVVSVNRTALLEADIAGANQPIAIVQAADQEAVPAGAAFEQPFDVFVTAFFGYQPPDGWSFFATGEIPPP